ncbi:hypothetical protein [uncultured Roseibium sp.]|uniref:hypothetical protein n=1 Tax=uncultured Roseibium sp. TaxID=1936171 RepID=UPI00260D30F0|nr:hypothetical protein [uncultured Roseibium sp.]
MGGSSKKTQQQTQKTVNEPYSAAKPLLNTAMGDALKAYNDDGLIKPNTMSTVVPFDKRTTQGMNALEAAANQNIGSKGLSGQMQGVINSGGFTAPQSTAVGYFGDVTAGNRDVDAGQSFASQNLSDIASGKMLGGGDPYFEEVLNRAGEEARFAVDRGAQAAGRYGSEDHSGNVASEITDLQTRARSGQYNQERAAQVAATQLLDQNRLADANIEAGNVGRQMQGASQMFNMGQTGFGNLPTAFQNMQAPAQTLTSLGGAYEDLAGRELNDDLRIQSEQDNEELANMQALLGIASGAGGYGTSTAQAQVPVQNNGFSNALGLGLTGASLLSGGFF